MELLVPFLATLLDLLVTALTKNPALAPHLGPLAVKTMTALSRSVGETPEETAARRQVAEATFTKQSAPLA